MSINGLRLYALSHYNIQLLVIKDFLIIKSLFDLLLQYLEMRFSKRTRQLVTITFIINQFLMLPVYMFVPSLAFSQGIMKIDFNRRRVTG